VSGLRRRNGVGVRWLDRLLMASWGPLESERGLRAFQVGCITLILGFAVVMVVDGAWFFVLIELALVAMIVWSMVVGRRSRRDIDQWLAALRKEDRWP
jgi:hypothetical protein